mmetsp:Transcript_26534/g.74248  ORF Transcript_26534/g.74248 Transcript_26534/m.74248 type:complete len:87 (+) Transcript_26534:143-403(+)
MSVIKEMAYKKRVLFSLSYWCIHPDRNRQSEASALQQALQQEQIISGSGPKQSAWIGKDVTSPAGRCAQNISSNPVPVILLPNNSK